MGGVKHIPLRCATRAGPERNTLTQMSTDGALFATAGSVCYSHAVQVELSRRLRKQLGAGGGDSGFCFVGEGSVASAG